MDNVNNFYHFKSPTLIGSTQLGAPKELREQWVKEAYNLDYNSYQTNLYTQMSSYHIWNETKTYNQLLENIQTKINDTYLAQMKLDAQVAYRIEEAWTAIYKEGEYAKPHSHYKYKAAWCYYMKVGDQPTPIVFDQIDFAISPKEDTLVIFDADLIHSVPPHRGEDRVVLAGNCSICHKDYLIEFKKALYGS